MNNNILTQVNWQVRHDLGTNLYADSLERDGRKFGFRLNLSKPIIHADSQTKEKTLSYLVLTRVATGSASGNESKFSIKLPKFREVNKKINLGYTALNVECERIVLKATSNQIAKLSEVDHFLRPVSDIIYKLYSDTFINFEEGHDDRFARYLELLQDLDLIKKVDDGYKENSKFIGLKNRASDFNNFKHLIYSHILSEAYETLRNFFNFTFIEPYIKIENSYYADSVESNKLLKRTKQDMYSQYLLRYHKMRQNKFNNDVHDLVTVGSFSQNANILSGQQEIFEEVSSLREREIDFARIVH